MERWSCPACGREFGRAKQGHVCVPSGSIDDAFRGFPPGHRAIYDAIVSHLLMLGEIHIDPVQVGVFLLRRRKVAEVRPRPNGVHLGLALPRRLEHPRFLATKHAMGDRSWQSLTLHTAEDVDEEVLDWLTEAFLAAE